MFSCAWMWHQHEGNAELSEVGDKFLRRMECSLLRTQAVPVFIGFQPCTDEPRPEAMRKAALDDIEKRLQTLESSRSKLEAGWLCQILGTWVFKTTVLPIVHYITKLIYIYMYIYNNLLYISNTWASLSCEAQLASGTTGDDLRPAIEELTVSIGTYKTAASSVRSLLPKAKAKAKSKPEAAAAE